jgi:hypothetical protein
LKEAVVDDKKQKILIAVLAVAGLGAGSYYFLLREAPNAAPTMATDGGGRKERKVSADTNKKDTRKEREKRAEAPAEPEGRKEREARPTTEASGRKKRDGKGTEAVKKKKIVPAA